MRSWNLVRSCNFRLARRPFNLLIAVVQSILTHGCCLHFFCDPCTVELGPMLLLSIFYNQSVVLIVLRPHTLSFWCITCGRLAPLRVIAAISLHLSTWDRRLPITIGLAATVWILSGCFLYSKSFAPYFNVQDVTVLFVRDIVLTINFIFSCWWSRFLFMCFTLFHLTLILLHYELHLLLVAWSITIRTLSIPILSNRFSHINLIFVSFIKISKNLIKLCFHFSDLIVWLRVFFLQVT